MTGSLHIRNTVIYSIIKNNLCFICYSKLDKGQENLNSCCYGPNNTFCVRRNFYVNRIRCVRVHTKRHHRKRKSCYRDVPPQTSNHEEELALWKWKEHMDPLLV